MIKLLNHLLMHALRDAAGEATWTRAQHTSKTHSFGRLPFPVAEALLSVSNTTKNDSNGTRQRVPRHQRLEEDLPSHLEGEKLQDMITPEFGIPTPLTPEPDLAVEMEL